MSERTPKPRQSKWRVHDHAWCENVGCEWTSDNNYLTAASQARRHAASTGHEVHGEQGYAYRYNAGASHVGH